VIVVAGEALVDLVTDRAGGGGRPTVSLGGAPYNVARACGRLGADVALVASISTDGHGDALVQALADDSVALDLVSRTDAPTTIAHADVDVDGVARYRFEIDGTAAPALTSVDVPTGAIAVFTGGLGLVLEPMGTSIERAVVATGGSALVMVDLNCRPAVIADRSTYLARVDRVLARADVVKASDEDLRFVSHDLDAIESARRLLRLGPRIVLLTAGGAATTVVCATGERVVDVPAVPVVDTIGAGDAFAAGFLTWWTIGGRTASELTDIDAVERGVVAGHQVAAVVVGRRGADPPTRSDLPPTWPP